MTQIYKKKKTAFIFSLIFFLCGGKLFAAEKNLVYNQSFDMKVIEALDISLNYEELKIYKIYGNEISIEICSNNSKIIPSIFCRESNFKIISNEKKDLPGNTCCIYLYLPQDFNPSSIKISAQNSIIYAQELKALSSITIKNIDGRTDIDSCKVEYLNLESQTGNQRLQKLSADYFELKNGSGSIFVEMNNPPLAKSTISSQSGKIQVYLPKSAALQISELFSTSPDRHYFTSAYKDKDPLPAQLLLSTKSGTIQTIEF